MAIAENRASISALIAFSFGGFANGREIAGIVTADGIVPADDVWWRKIERRIGAPVGTLSAPDAVSQDDVMPDKASKIAAVCAAQNGSEMPAGYELIGTGTRLFEGWEADNKLWVIDGPDGRFLGSTSHCAPYVAEASELDEAIQETVKSVESLMSLRNLLTTRWR